MSTRRATLVLGLALALVPVGFGGSASAVVVDRELVSASTASDSTRIKSLTASCPAGKQLVGTGADTFGGASDVAIDDVIPNAELTGVTVTAIEDETGFAGDWAVAAHAICANPLPGLQRVVATSASNSNSIKSLSAGCPAGKQLTGVGGDIAGGVGQVVIDDLTPNAALTSATVTAIEDQNGTTANWDVRAYAICATPPAGLERAATTSPTNSDPSKFLNATCPDGKQVLGVGGEIVGGVGEVRMSELSPIGGLPEVTVAHAFEDDTGTAKNWSLTAFAICAPSAHLVVATSLNNSADKSVTATCPAGEQVTGGGGDITGGLGQVMTNALVPPDPPPPTSFRMGGVEDETAFTGSWFVRSYAICAGGLPGLERRFGTSNNQSTTSKTVTAPPCPAGKQVVGAGAGTSGATREVVLDGVVPDDALTTVTATGHEDETGTTSNWTLTAYAICATPPPGLELVSATSLPEHSDPASVPASCPSGKNLLGAGAAIGGGEGQVVLDDLRINPALTRVTASGLEDQNGFADEWDVTAYAICASP